MVRLGDICRFINGDRGKNYPSQAEISSEGDIPFVNAGHLVGGELDFSDMNYISEKKYNQLNSGKIQENDILYCLRGSLGKKAIIRGISRGAIASSLVIIRPDARLINSDYLFYALDSPTVQEQMMQANNGSSQPNLSAKSVSDYTFNLPDINDQHEIVSKLSKISELIALRKEQLAKLDELIKSRFIELFGDPEDSATKWERTNFASVCLDMHQGINTVADKVEYVNSGFPIIQSKNITSGFLDLDDVRYVKESDYEYYRDKYNPKPSDLLVCNIGTIGKSLIVEEEEDFLIAWNLFLIKLNKELANPIFIKVFIELLNQQNYFEKYMTGGTVKFVNKKTMGNISTPLPPLELQKQFAAFVEQTDKSKLEIQQSLEKLETLKKSLMQKYFG